MENAITVFIMRYLNILKLLRSSFSMNKGIYLNFIFADTPMPLQQLLIKNNIQNE